MDIYTLKALAHIEQVSYSYLRQLVAGSSKDEPLLWRGWRFFGPGAKYWLAYPDGQDVRFHDEADVIDQEPPANVQRRYYRKPRAMTVDNSTDTNLEELAT